MSEPRQRWRLVFARDEEARYLSHLDAVHLWERAFRRGSIPIAVTEGFTPRSRLIFAAPLPLGMLAEHELADLFLAEKLTLPDLRGRLATGMPGGYRAVDLRDEWLGAPALATQMVAADYRMDLLGVGPGDLAAACRRLLEADSLPRVRRRETRATPYDLRPLLLDLKAGPPRAVADSAAPAANLWLRLRHTQDQGSGRPEEVVAALGECLGASEEALEMVAPVRERIWLAGELGS